MKEIRIHGLFTIELEWNAKEIIRYRLESPHLICQIRMNKGAG